MVVLKKLKASSIIEVLTASVLIVIVFMVASLILNNVFKNAVVNTDSGIENKIRELSYLCIHNKIKLPYTEDFKDYSIYINKNNDTFSISYENLKTNTTKDVILNAY